MRAIVDSFESEFRRYKELAEKTFAQVSDEELGRTGSNTDNSIATLIWHISGNLESRFTDFLTSDGEKPWRQRESEFETRSVEREQALEKWERGWSRLFDTLGAMGDNDLVRSVSIRQEPLAVHAALARSLAHTSYHVGQIVYLGKMMRSGKWAYLSIPPARQ